MKTAEKIHSKAKMIRGGNGKIKSAREANGYGKGTRKTSAKKLVVEMYGGEPYSYYPYGKYIVVAPGVCGGRLTFKYTRIRVEFILQRLASGRTIPDLIESYRQSNLTEEAIMEAMHLARKALMHSIPLRIPQFRTKARRMGFIARLRPTRIEYYGVEQATKTIEW